MRRLARDARTRRAAALVLGVLAAVAALSACASDGPPSEAQAPPDETRAMYLGDVLEGGRTYRLPGGGWLIDVPEGMRLYYSFQRGSADTLAGVLYGLRDLGTGSFIGIHQHTGEVLRHAFGETPAQVSAAEARLDRIAAAFRRLP
ncbi:MAG: hypothetical protein F4X25_12050 [Chloroflexi bacterium]|nr:hypothetical protein [Chloroflexota bacterium]